MTKARRIDSAARPTRRQWLFLSSAVMATGCFGSFGLTNLVYDWNGRIENRWARSLVFLALAIVPVYVTLLVIDALVLNTIEFWTDESAVQGNDDEVRIRSTAGGAAPNGVDAEPQRPIAGDVRERLLEDGRRVRSQRTDQMDMVRHQILEGARCVDTLYMHRVGATELRLLDADRQLVMRALRSPQGGIEVRNASGLLISAVSEARAERMAQAVADGRGVSETVYQELTAPRPS